MNNSEELNQYWSDLAAVLVHMKRFQEATLRYRTTLGFPKNGLSKIEAAQWYKTLYDSETTDAKNKFAFESTEIFMPPNKFVVEQVENLANEFNLDERWYIDLLFYLMGDDNKLSAPFGDVDIVTRVNDPKLPFNKQVVISLNIVINKDTSLKDVERIWATIKQYQSRMKTSVPKRRRLMDNTKTYIKIRELEDQGVLQKDIPTKIAEIKKWDATDIASFKQRIEKRFKPQK